MNIFLMAEECKLKGSGGYLVASISEEQKKKADLGVGELFLAPVGRIPEENITSYFCNNCNQEFKSPPTINYENPNEEVAENMKLIEKGMYLCTKCESPLGEYREFQKK